MQGTNIFHPLTPELDKFLQAHPRGYHPFASISSLLADASPATASDSTNNATGVEDDSDDDEDGLGGMLPYPSPPPPGSLDPDDISNAELDRVLVVLRGNSDRATTLGVSLIISQLLYTPPPSCCIHHLPLQYSLCKGRHQA